MSDQPHIEFKRDGTSLKVAGLKPVGQIAQYAADTIGILGEPLGILKDKLAAFRVNQAESAAIAMQRAKEIRQDEGRKVEKVSQKYLSNWIEGASQEESEAENLLELWARLLAQSGEEFDALFLSYNEVLRKIGPSEAKLILSMLNPIFINGLYGGDQHTYRWCTVEDCARANEKLINEFTGLFDTNQVDLFSRDPNQLNRCARLLSRLLDGFICELTVYYDDGSGYGWGGHMSTPDILEHAGVVELKQKTWSRADGCSLKIEWATPTKIGLGLFFELNKKRLEVVGSLDEFDTKFTRSRSTLNRVPALLRRRLGISLSD
ncbi:hypothetical protein [Phaeobacter inhibens]|uniref:hypothetical protein n=1 Tax=Phaeobacter inhibens TaxID=221822 RepID=UPI0021A88A40|nr:hypothetical protein [Phaeobacter inhibens]UWR59542.1 hypothetical protein K4F88_11435 [Phaeobacter inhibens]